MIKTEDEKEILDGRYPAIVPFLMQESDRNIDFEIYSGVKDITNEFIRKFPNKYFSNAALEWLDDNISPYLDKAGYYRYKQGRLRWYHSYTAKYGDKINTSKVLGTTIMLDRQYKNLTTFDIDELLDKKLYTFVTVIDGCVVSAASVNEHQKGQNMLEITVETAVNARGKGYAVSNAAALADYLIKNGYSVAYCCSRYNAASRKIALDIGLRHDGRFYAVDAYRR